MLLSNNPGVDIGDIASLVDSPELHFIIKLKLELAVLTYILARTPSPRTTMSIAEGMSS